MGLVGMGFDSVRGALMSLSPSIGVGWILKPLELEGRMDPINIILWENVEGSFLDSIR